MPSHWVLTGDGRYGQPIYTNVQYPFPTDPPHVPDDNPTGDYRRTFEHPGWDGGTHAAAVRRRRIGLSGVAERHRDRGRQGQSAGAGVRRHRRPPARPQPDHGPGAPVVVDELPRRSRSVVVAGHLPRRDPARPAGRRRWTTSGCAPRTTPTAKARSLPRSSRPSAAYPVSIEIPELGVTQEFADADQVRSFAVGDVEPWSAEEPRLYDVQIRSAGETVTLRLGFRTVRIAGDRFLVNGARVVFRGMNRHEAHPVRGRVFDHDHARADLISMKRAGVNAIRTSHYPPHPARAGSGRRARPVGDLGMRPGDPRLRLQRLGGQSE